MPKKKKKDHKFYFDNNHGLKVPCFNCSELKQHNILYYILVIWILEIEDFSILSTNQTLGAYKEPFRHNKKLLIN